MESLHQLEIIILLLAAVLALTTLSQRMVIPYPILIVLGGLLLGILPGVPTVTFHPDLVFLVFLPPILWAAAYFTSFRDFRQNLRPISLLAVGLVLATTAAVAVVAHLLLPGISWPGALVLGAIVSPPDAVSATAIARRLHIPGRIVTILEGESLVNDATALVVYRAAVGAVITGTFSWSDALLDFAFAAITGILLGVAVSFLTRWALCATEDSFTQIGMTLLAPYLAWVTAETVHGSAVLACVAGGLHLRRNFSGAVSPATRIQARAVWEVLVFLLNGVIFILIGLQLGALRQAIPAGQGGTLLIAALSVSAAAIVVRLIWVPLAAIIPRALPSIRKRDPMPPWAALFVIGWTGMRGIVTLAAAMALPVTTAAGTPFPFRAEILLISFAVILVTLVGQGLSLPPLIRLLPTLPDPRNVEEEERLGREHAATAALRRLDGLAGEHWLLPEQVDRLRLHYGRRVERFAVNGQPDQECSTEVQLAFRRLRHETLSAERLALIALRNDGTISDEVLHRLEHELDVEALRLGIGERRVDRQLIAQAKPPAQ